MFHIQQRFLSRQSFTPRIFWQAIYYSGLNTKQKLGASTTWLRLWLQFSVGVPLIDNFVVNFKNLWHQNQKDWSKNDFMKYSLNCIKTRLSGLTKKTSTWLIKIIKELIKKTRSNFGKDFKICLMLNRFMISLYLIFHNP